MKAPVVTNRSTEVDRLGSDTESPRGSPSACRQGRPARMPGARARCNPGSMRLGKTPGAPSVVILSVRPDPVADPAETLCGCVSLSLRARPTADQRLLGVLAVSGGIMIGHCLASAHGLLAHWPLLTQWVQRAIL
jgi:hypothetical protein